MPTSWSGLPRSVRRSRAGAVAATAALLLAAGLARAASDPGVRGGAAGAGGPLSGLTAQEAAFFAAGSDAFQEVDAVPGGLGPRFNMNSCAGCHAQPAVGGSSPAVNPQVAVATLAGALNQVPWFVVANGPVREARFKRNPDGSPDGGVHALFVITGRTDAAGCNIAQPDFGAPGDPLSGLGGSSNVIFRIPTPTFGAGLIESIGESTILANKRAFPLAKLLLGISGKENRTGNDGTITRFGWKAQNKSLRIFSGEAYNVEQGVTNELFPHERSEAPGCVLNPTPEDTFDLGAATLVEGLSDVEHFSNFMAFLAPAVPAPPTSSSARGSQVFDSIGCALCHTRSLPTGTVRTGALSGASANLFSDLLLHDMGVGLADGVSQGRAGPREFRSAPLWGLGQRIFFLHDGRTSDLLQAILAHASDGSEANAVVFLFNQLSDSDRQDLLNYLRSL
ncbi:MAG TPA: di-heme oxidoredictase family protein [Anaeromyxobacter sp.]